MGPSECSEGGDGSGAVVSADTSIRVRVLCFSHVRAVLGRAELDLEMPAGSTAGDVRARIVGMGEGRLSGMPMKIACNRAFVDAETPLADGDELALIPPVQGGSPHAPGAGERCAGDRAASDHDTGERDVRGRHTGERDVRERGTGERETRNDVSGACG